MPKTRLRTVPSAGMLARLAVVVLTAGIAVPRMADACGPNPPPPLKEPPVPISCQICPRKCSGSPCYVRSGAFQFSVEDLSIPTPGFPIRVSRYYESARPFDGPLGRGWTLNLPTRVFYSTYRFTGPSTYSKEADVTMPNGDRVRFTENANGTYTPQADRHDTLVKNADQSFDMTLQRSRQKYHFLATGSISTMTDDSGNALNLTYDANGRLQTVADGAGSGRSLTITWGGDGRISSIQDNAGRVIIYGYDPSGNGTLTSVTDVAGRVTTYSYQLTGSGWLLYGAVENGTGNWGRLLQSATYETTTCHTTSATMGGETFDYDYDNGVPNRTIKSGAGIDGSWWFYFTPEGWVTDRVRVYGATGSGGPTYHTDYYPDGSIQQTIDEVGVRTYYTYNSAGFLLTVTRDYLGPNAIRFDYVYDTNFPDRVVSITPKNPSDGSVNLNWQAWKYDYYQTGMSPGSLFHVYRVKDDGTTLETMATYVYNSKGQVTQYTSPTLAVTDYTYDASWNLWKVTGPANNDAGTRPVTTYGYDNLGRATSVQDALGHTTTYTYDNLNRVLTVTLPKPSTSSSLDFTTTYSYDNYDSLTGLTFTIVKDPNGLITGKVTKQGYDQWGRLIQVIDALGNVTSYSYDNGLLRTMTDANGNVKQYDYDDLTRRLIGTRRGDGTPLDSWTYNDDGTLQIFYSRDGWRRNTYDHLKRVSRRDSAAPFFDFTYVGQKLTQVGEGDGYGWTQTNTMTYDHSYRLDTVTEGTRGTIDYGYNADDSRASYAVTGGPTATYAYYPDGSPNTIAWTPVAGNFKYRYTLAGQYQSLTYPNGGTRNYTYDDQGRLTQLTNLDPVAGNLATYAYGYDYNNTNLTNTMLGQRTSMVATVPSQGLSNHTFKYEYDWLYQLTKVNYPNIAPFSNETDSWTYDAIGNRMTNTVNGSTQNYTYEQVLGHQGQRLTSDGVNAYTYNGGGYSGSIGSRSGPGGNFTFTWTSWGEMSQINSGNLANYYYDYKGRRFQKSMSGTTTNYLYDRVSLVRESTGSTISDYLFGPGIDEPIALSRGGQAYYFGADGLGSVAVVANTSGAVQATYLYDVWGTIRNSPSSFANAFGYTARETGEAGTNYYRARYYQPSIGRFLAEDPLPAALGVKRQAPYVSRLRLYPYVTNSPLRFVDPSGLLSGNCNSPHRCGDQEWPAMCVGCCHLEMLRKACGLTALERAEDLATIVEFAQASATAACLLDPSDLAVATGEAVLGAAESKFTTLMSTFTKNCQCDNVCLEDPGHCPIMQDLLELSIREAE